MESVIFRRRMELISSFAKAIEAKHHSNVLVKKIGYKEVMEVVEDTLIRYSGTPINIAEALVMASADKNVHLDCVYFLMRREPDAMPVVVAMG
jgi:hypothetical protein